MKRYFIGHGTSTTAETETIEELNNCFNNLPDIDRHFCRLYDTVAKLTIAGWKYQYDHDWNKAEIWN